MIMYLIKLLSNWKQILYEKMPQNAHAHKSYLGEEAGVLDAELLKTTQKPCRREKLCNSVLLL